MIRIVVVLLVCNVRNFVEFQYEQRTEELRKIQGQKRPASEDGDELVKPRAWAAVLQSKHAERNRWGPILSYLDAFAY